MKLLCCSIIVGSVLLAMCGRASAYPGTWDDWMRDGGVVVDHQPRRAGGQSADSAFINYLGQEAWQFIADDFSLVSPGVVRRVAWWGFYYLNEEPPATETLRVRFYGSAGGLPDDENILYEELFVDPSRTATGGWIQAGGLPDEYFYEVDLASPVSLEPATPYWLEITQIGDIDSNFLLEYSETDMTGIAARNMSFPEWYQSLTVDLAFQLSTVPEPGSSGLIIVGLMLIRRRR